MRDDSVTGVSHGKTPFLVGAHLRCGHAGGGGGGGGVIPAARDGETAERRDGLAAIPRMRGHRERQEGLMGV